MIFSSNSSTLEAFVPLSFRFATLSGLLRPLSRLDFSYRRGHGSRKSIGRMSDQSDRLVDATEARIDRSQQAFAIDFDRFLTVPGRDEVDFWSTHPVAACCNASLHRAWNKENVAVEEVYQRRSQAQPWEVKSPCLYHIHPYSKTFRLTCWS